MYARQGIKSKDNVGPLVDDNGDTVQDVSKTANILNDYFCSVFHRENTDVLPEEQPMCFSLWNTLRHYKLQHQLF